jgi:predicted metal-dependent hydrolase
MDQPEIPHYVVEYVLYHEMLHVKHPTRKSGCSLISHSPEFRAEEKLFPEFERARKALDRLARGSSGLRFRLETLASRFLF